MKKKINYTLYITYHQIEEGGELCEGESGPYGSHEPTYLTTTFENIFIEQPTDRMFYETLEVSNHLYDALVKLKEVYLAAIFYSDGDTFGHTEGYYQIVGVYPTWEEAEEANTTILEDKSLNAYKPWEGYFSGLIGPEIFSLPIS